MADVGLFLAGAVALGTAATAYLLWQLPVVYVFCAGFVLTIFSGNWSSMGLPGFPFLPDRFLLIFALLMVAFRAPDTRGNPPLRLTAAHGLLALTLIYVAASAAISGTLGGSDATFALLDRFGAIPFLLFLAVPLIIRSQQDRLVLLTVLVGLGAYLGVMALFEATGLNALIFPRYIVDPTVGTIDGRVRGPFLSPVSVGFVLFACAAASAIAIAVHPRRVVRQLAWVVMPLSVLGCFLTLERGVWIATTGGALAAALSAPQLRRHIVPAALLAALGVALALAVVPGLQSRATDRAQTKQSVWDRQNQTAAALRMVADRPLFGFGWYRAKEDGLAYFRQPENYPMTGFKIEFHNVYLSNAAELGLVGTALWLLAQVVALGSALVPRGPPDLAPWRTGLIGLIGFLIVISAFNPFGQNFGAVLLWTWAGVTMAGAMATQPSRVVVPRAAALRTA